MSNNRISSETIGPSPVVSPEGTATCRRPCWLTKPVIDNSFMAVNGAGANERRCSLVGDKNASSPPFFARCMAETKAMGF